ncbi:MAG: hypothetical protein F9K35_13365 [Burkholderiaceae bacterium]|nr:MAG: hypothetical protein F9K35_13365 [Burkholderiaceae bacterium]
MELLTLALFLALGLYFLRAKERAARVALLGGYLGRYQIEKLMEALTEGYLRALGESDPQRRAQVWGLLATTEKNLSEQFQAFANDFARVDAVEARVSTFAVALPYAYRWLPGSSFDMREALQMHARGIAAVAAAHGEGGEDDRKRQAFTMTAELYLMQHTCHWFCRSATVASVRLMARHKTPYEQVLASVSPATRAAYRQVVGI